MADSGETDPILRRYIGVVSSVAHDALDPEFFERGEKELKAIPPLWDFLTEKAREAVGNDLAAREQVMHLGFLMLKIAKTMQQVNDLEESYNRATDVQDLGYSVIADEAAKEPPSAA